MHLADKTDQKNWNVEWTCRKWWAWDYDAGRPPYDVQRFPDNILLNNGINLLWQLVSGQSAILLNNANTRMKVGNSSTAPAATQTDLLGGSTLTKAMDATFPTIAGQSITFRSTFTSIDANFTWNEYAILNGAAVGAGVALVNRKVQLLGTKTSAEVWELTLTITMA